MNLDNVKYDVSVHRSDPAGKGVSQDQLPDMENWSLRTRDGEGNVVIVTAKINGKLIGKAMFGYWGNFPGLKADSVYVIPYYRKKGIANRMYDEAEKFIGGNVLPSVYQTKQGKGLWKKRITLKNIGEGISYHPDTHEFTFNWEKDEETDIINLVKTRKKISTKAGVEYYVSYVALPKDNKYTTEYKTAMNLFRDRLKTLTLAETDIDRMIDGAIDGFIGAYGNRLDNIGLIVTPKSTSVLNKRMSAKLHGLIPTARLADDLFAKSMVDDIKINTEKIKGTPEQQEETLKRVIRMLDNFKKKNVEFTLKKIHPKYRNLFGGFMKLSVELDSELLEIIKSKDVLVVDDFLTKGFTMKEINRILQNYKLEGSVVNFVLVLQG